jgi:uncharacterized phage infection (PIP) family protein YhgE
VPRALLLPALLRGPATPQPLARAQLPEPLSGLLKEQLPAHQVISRSATAAPATPQKPKGETEYQQLSAAEQSQLQEIAKFVNDLKNKARALGKLDDEELPKLTKQLTELDDVTQALITEINNRSEHSRERPDYGKRVQG